jgi:hypothetical protein
LPQQHFQQQLPSPWSHMPGLTQLHPHSPPPQAGHFFIGGGGVGWAGVGGLGGGVGGTGVGGVGGGAGVGWMRASCFFHASPHPEALPVV